MKILRQKVYNQPLGYNKRGFLTSPFLADEKTLNAAEKQEELTKKVWDNNKSIGTFYKKTVAEINSTIAKREKARRKQLRKLVGEFTKPLLDDNENKKEE